MLGPRRVEGYAIVSADGMIADAVGVMPQTIRNEADQRFLQAALDGVGVVVHGRHSHEDGPHADRRKRLILSRRIADLAPDPTHPNALLWNPAGATIERAIEALDAPEGAIAVIGGTEVFSMFLPLYDSFYLSCAARATIPDGRPVFAELAAGVTPAQILARHGLKPGPTRDLDAAAGISVTTFERQTSA